MQFTAFTLFAQPFAPAVGQPGTTAIFKDSSAFTAWATACKIRRGYQDISNPALGYASAGDSSLATDKAQANGVVSLGDGGSATCTFARPITDGPGYDFAVFENSFDGAFLELAFVEVSSDGLNFVRFPSQSLTDTITQTGSFGLTDPTKLDNLAGKYLAGYGTPFDLQQLSGNHALDITAVTHVRLIDVVGSVNDLYTTRDSQGRKVNDPWPTAFASGGFDLDAVGVIHESIVTGIVESKLDQEIMIFPNPVSGSRELQIESSLPINSLRLDDLFGKTLLLTDNRTIHASGLASGVYLLTIITDKGCVQKKIILQ